MKDFSKKRFRISNSATEVKLAYTGFLAFVLVGYLTIVLIGVLRVGPGIQDIAAHYRGSEDGELFPRAFGQMLEEAHFHAFIEGLILLVLTHLFVATHLKRKTKMIVIILAYGSTFIDLASPWLIKYVMAAFAYLQFTNWFVMTFSALILIGVPFYEMWFKKGEKK